MSSRAEGSNFLTRIYEDLHLETAPPAKRFKIHFWRQKGPCIRVPRGFLPSHRLPQSQFMCALLPINWKGQSSFLWMGGVSVLPLKQGGKRYSVIHSSSSNSGLIFWIKEHGSKTGWLMNDLLNPCLLVKVKESNRTHKSNRKMFMMSRNSV